MQRIVSILRTAILNPLVMLLDEPLSSIDEINRDDLHEKLINYKVSDDALIIAQEIGNDYAICANKMSRNRNCSLSRF